MKRIAIIGGGPAGMIAGIKSAENGNEVYLFEKNEKLGKKLYITGKGRCNLTNDTNPFSFLENVVSNLKFLLSAINAFSPKKTMIFFEQLGLPLKIERGNRVFPSSDKASDVTKTLEKKLVKSGVKIIYNETVTELLTKNEQIIGLKTDTNDYKFDSIIVATGGKSYPSTGSTGDGYAFAKSVGHTITTPKPSLVGFNLKGDFYKAVQGLSLKNVQLSILRGQKLIYSELGEMLFTHFGVSGPLVLSASCHVCKEDLYNISAFIDFKPALDYETLEKRILRDLEEFKGKNMSNSLIKLLPRSLIDVVLSVAKIPTTKNNCELTKAERDSLINTLKSFPLQIRSTRGFEEAIITSGGVSTKEINPKTMESKIIKGMYFAGEVIDVDAYTGGYNIQIALSTGYLAGINA